MYSNNLTFSVARAFHAIFIDIPVAFWALLSSVSAVITELANGMAGSITCALQSVGSVLACGAETAATAVLASTSAWLPQPTIIIAALTPWTTLI